MSRFSLHVQAWDQCQRCQLHRTRQHVCHLRGRVPCDVLFIGEAPGLSEDALGAPFVGQAGHLLNRIIANALPKGCTHALTNIVGCIPLDDDGAKATEPSVEAIRACAPRLADLLSITAPRLVVLVGGMARDWAELPPGQPHAVIIHPAAILRMPVAAQGMACRRAEVVMRSAWEEVIAGMAPPSGLSPTWPPGDFEKDIPF